MDLYYLSQFLTTRTIVHIVGTGRVNPLQMDLYYLSQFLTTRAIVHI